MSFACRVFIYTAELERSLYVVEMMRQLFLKNWSTTCNEGRVKPRRGQL